MKRFLYVMMLAAIGMIAIQTHPALSAEPQNDAALAGSWSMTVNATDSSGKPCPFVPETFRFYKDQTVVLSNFGSQHLPFKTSVTTEERQIIEKRVPELKGKNLLLIKPSPNLDWSNTPMVYAYSVDNNELTLILQDWSPAKFARTMKKSFR